MNNPQASGRPLADAGVADTGASAVPGVLLPQPAPDAHKHARGAVVIVAGGIEGVGAPRLAARMALRIGAGLVTIAASAEAMAAHAARGPDALMLRMIETGDALAALAVRQPSGLALVIGPALGFDTRAEDLLAAALDLPCALVLDADALTMLARESGWRARLMERSGATVLTPHEGEFLRLDPDAGLKDAGQYARAGLRLDAATRMAVSCGAVVVLKGRGTVIAAPTGQVAVNPTGSSALATAGSGDVLAGAVAGLMAQGTAAFEAARAAVWLHGRAGEALGYGLIADDLPEMIGTLRWQTAGQ
jgi:hydroxyethylthiazole kinase-like uncharacterized protein yjeF